MYSLKHLDAETQEKLKKTMKGEHSRFQQVVQKELQIEMKKYIANPDEVAQKRPMLTREQVEKKALNKVLSHREKRYMFEKDSSLDLLAMAAKMMAEDDHPEAAVDSKSEHNRSANPNWKSTSQPTTWEFEDFDSLPLEERTNRLKSFKKVTEMSGRQFIRPKGLQEGPFEEPTIEEEDDDADIKVEVIDDQYEAASSSSNDVMLLKEPKIEDI